MPRLVSLVVLVVTVPLFCQQSSVGTRTQQWVWSRGHMMRADTPPELNEQAILQRTIHQDAQELFALSATLQSDLEQLQKGVHPKDLARDLKKVEKLSKKLRQEVS
jgi:hypothetical protein